MKEKYIFKKKVDKCPKCDSEEIHIIKGKIRCADCRYLEGEFEGL